MELRPRAQRIMRTCVTAAPGWNNVSCNRLLDEGVQPCKACQISMPYFRKRPIVFWSLPFLIFLSGCDAKPECDSVATRNAVLQTVSDDHNNALVEYAAKNSTIAKSIDVIPEAEKSKQKPLYVLGEKMVTTSTRENK